MEGGCEAEVIEISARTRQAPCRNIEVTERGVGGKWGRRGATSARERLFSSQAHSVDQQ